MRRLVRRIRAPRTGWIVVALIAVALTASAQVSLEASEVVGKWAGTLHAAGRSPATVEVEFRPDGAFEGESNGTRSDEEVSYEGRWRVEGRTIRVDFTAEGADKESEVSWRLKRNDGELTGVAVRRLGRLRYDVRLRRVR